MIGILSVLAFLVLQDVSAQAPCVPEPVKNINLTLDYQLSWEPSTNCVAILYFRYVINIHYDDDELLYEYASEDNWLDVSFLPACERFTFEITVSVDNALSNPTRFVSYIPAPSGADLTITSFEATVQDGGATFLNWHVTDKFSHCARGFRLVIHDSVTPIPRDIYTDRNFLFVNNLIPCGVYEFGIMAIYNLQSEGPINLIEYVAPQEVAPLLFLERINEGDTYVNISWSLPPYSVNRCRITGVEVEGLPFYHRTFPVYDIPERPLFTTSLDNLIPDNMYMLRVSVVNEAGSSQIYPIGVQTLPTTGP